MLEIVIWGVVITVLSATLIYAVYSISRILEKVNTFAEKYEENL